MHNLVNDTFITIFTATYNRAKYLPRLYESLKRQSIFNFEWLVIDDDSIDETEEVINGIIKNENRFKIRYYKQQHGGKHRALNKAFDMSKGKYIFPVDSDDYLLDDSIENVNKWLLQIDDNEQFIGISGLRINSNAEILGGIPKVDTDAYIDASVFDRGKYNLGGDKAEIFLLSACRKNKFPEFENEYFVTEAVCWDAISSNGKMIRWFNRPIYVCDYLPEGLTRNGANDIKGHKENYQGYCFYIRQCLALYHGIYRAEKLWNYYKTNRSLGKSICEQAKGLKMYLPFYLFELCKLLFWGIKIKVTKFYG